MVVVDTLSLVGTIYEFSFNALQIVSCVVLLVLYIWKRNSRIIQSRLFIPHFILSSNIMFALAVMLGYIHPTAKCHLKIAISLPLTLGVVLAYFILVGRHLVMQRLEILKVQFLRKNSSMTSTTSIDSTDLTLSDIALYDSGSEEDEAHQEVEDIEKETMFKNSQDGIQQEDPPVKEEGKERVNVVEKVAVPDGTMETQGEKPKPIPRSKKTSKLLTTQSLHFLKTISKPWFLLLVICSYSLLYHIVLWIAYFSVSVNEEQGFDFVGRCTILSRWVSFFVAGSMTSYIGVLFILLLLNGLAFKEEISKCRWKLVFIDNDPFLFTITSTLLLIFMTTCGIIMSVLAATRVDLNTFYGGIPTNLFWASPATWVICGIPVLYAIIQDYRLLVIEKEAKLRKQEAEMEKKKADKLDLFLEFQVDGEGVRSIMKHKEISKLFEKFSMKEYSVENVLLYKKIQKFQSYCKKNRHEKARKLALQIYDTFICTSSPMEANITNHCRSGIKTSIDQLKNKEEDVKLKSLEIFDQCECEITANLCDTYRRFHGWSEFRDYIHTKGGNRV